MATKGRDRDRHDPQDAHGERAAAVRAEVVEILAAVVLELLLKPGPDLSPDGPLHAKQALNYYISGQIRGPQ